MQPFYVSAPCDPCVFRLPVIRWGMIRKSIPFQLVILVTMFLLSPACDQTRTSLPALPGNPAPPFTLKDANGKIVSLSDLSGKVVVLDFWATWCGPCKDAVGELETLQKKFADRGVIIVGISVNKESDAAVRVQEFAKRHGLTYPLVIDDGSAYKAYGVTRIPATYILDRGHIIRETYPGFRHGISSEISQRIDKLLESPSQK